MSGPHVNREHLELVLDARASLLGKTTHAHWLTRQGFGVLTVWKGETRLEQRPFRLADVKE